MLVEPQSRETSEDSEADLYPVTSAQRRLWFLDLLQPGLTAYNLLTAIDLRGALDLARLRAAANAVVLRHDALRTFFAELDGSLWQVVLPWLDVELPMIDLSGLSADRREEAARALAGEALAFDLAQGPLLRLRLLRLSASRHSLRVEIHHIVADGRSLRVFARDLMAFYSGSSLPPAGQLSSFAAWQAEARTREALEPGLAYWRERLAGAPSLQQLPTDRARPRRPSFRGAVERLDFPAEHASALAGVGRREGATAFMTLLATWLVLLHRWSWRTDLLVGIPVTNRDRPELADAVGFFVDVVVIRVGLDGRTSFVELLRRTRDAVLDAIAHQEVPLDLVVDDLRLDRRLDHQPFLQLLFGLSEESGKPGDTAMRAAGIEARLVEMDADESAKGDLSLVLDSSEEGLGAWLKYAVDLYDRGTVQRLLRGYGNLLAGLVADPGRPCAELPMMDEEERRQVLREWSGVRRPGPPPCPVHEVFRRRARLSPDAPAFESGDVTLSYGELEARSNRLARVLAGLGVGGESPVGICLALSADFLVAVLAVLKAGGVYLPLDPGLPTARLAVLIRDAGARWAVTLTDLAATLPVGVCEPVFLDGQSIASASSDPVAALCAPESLAYIMYTSGSTGVPKGVAVPHRAIHRLVVGSDYLQLGEHDRVALAAHPGFDASTLEIWGALLNGGCLVHVSRELLLSPPEFFAHLAATRVTMLWITKSLFDQMARHDPVGFAGIDHVLTGGEALDPGMVRHVLARLTPGSIGDIGGTRLRNCYGPTENTTFTTVQEIEAVPERALGVPIGRPIRGTCVYLVDPGFQPVPAGVAGELYTGGEGLARGYVGDPALTAASFVPDPFSEVPGARLYRTRDLARWRADGAIEFLGRVDHQVKIHGFRIEPAEIEAELARHPGVRAAAVLAREDEPGVKRLVAYVVPAGPDAAGLLAGLRGFLAERLPSFLVPHAFVALPELPVNANGKLDRDALPLPDPSAGAPVKDSEPRTPVERALAEVWKEVLRRPAVGIHDNFFEIGGDSILSIRLVARARQQGLEITPAQLFEVQTIAGLAAALEADGVEDRSPMPPIPDETWKDEEIRTGLSRRACLVDDAVRRAAPNRLDRSLAFYFTPGQTAAVVERVPARYRITPAELVLAALARILTRWARAASLLVDVIDPRPAGRMGGRLLLDLSDLDNPDACLAAVKEPRRLAAGPLPELLFGYHVDTGAARAAHHAIGVAAGVTEGRLRVEWTYDANLFHPLVLEGLMRDHASEIMALAEHCLHAPSAGYTASDFPLAGLDRDALERLLGADRDVEDLYPLTPLQESMLAYSLGRPRSEVSFEQLCYAVEGGFDAGAFERAWELALERHAILRTAFLWRGLARPLQVVRRDVRLPFRLLDWRHLDAGRQERRLAQFLERDRGRGFELDRAPLLRLAVARVAADRAYVVFSFHHALLDGWSLEHLDREILQAFQALRSGAAPVSHPARPYRDYVAWLQRQDSKAVRESFRALLGTFADPIEIPDADSERSEERRRLLTEDESAGLIRFARQHGLTLGTMAQAAWGHWLGRAFGREDVVFGLTVSGRPADLPGVEEMLGLFIHNLPVRLSLAGGPLLDRLRELQAQVAETSRLVPIPEAELQGLSAVPPSRRLYETLVVVENLPTGDAAWSGLGDLRLERVSSQLKTRHPLTLVVIPGERIELRLVHHVHRVPGEAARQMLDDVCAILLALPGLSLSDLPEPTSASILLPRATQPAASERPDLPAVLPRDLLELRLSQIAEEVLEYRPPGVTANLFESGLDSVRLVRLARRLGEELGRDLPFAILFERPTVAGLAEWLRAGAVELPWSPLVTIQTGQKRPAFFCVHPLAGNVIAFLDLAAAMGEDQPFYALQAPGADGRHEPLDRLEDIAALYVDAVRRRQPRGPYRLGGYSFGGVVAFEMARQMVEQGDEIALLAILDTPAPSETLSEEAEEKDDLFWLRQIVHMRERFLDLDLGLDGLEPLNEEDRLRRVAEALAQAEVLPADADAALMKQLVRVSRAQYQAYVRYRPAGPYPGRITLLRSEELHPEEASDHLRRAFQDPAMGWGALSPLPVRVIHVPGDHVTLLVRPQVETVAARLREAIQPDLTRS
jgi:amino acid adenylation domain-containing protein